MASEIDRNDRIGKPRQPFEEVIRMTGPSPKTNIADRLSVRRVALERAQLLIGDRFSDDGQLTGSSSPIRSCIRRLGFGLWAATTIERARIIPTAACDCRNQNIRRGASLPH